MNSYPSKLSKGHQAKFNSRERSIEHALDESIKDFIKNQTTLELDSLRVFHVSTSLKTCLKTHRYNKSNGFTLLYLSFKNADPLFQVAVCSTKDTYNRLTGRITVKERVVNSLKEKGLGAFLSYDMNDNVHGLVPYRYIANRFIKENLITVSKKQNTIGILSCVDENDLQKMALEKLTLQVQTDAEERNVNNQIDKDSFAVAVQHIRYYQDNNKALFEMGTVGHFKRLNRNSNNIRSTGGLTLQVITFSVVNSELNSSKQFVAVTWANCSTEDVYSKEYGRKQCFQNIIKGRYKIFTYTPFSSGEEFNDYCIRYLEQQIQYPINFNNTSETTI